MFYASGEVCRLSTRLETLLTLGFRFTIPSAEYQEKHKLRFRVEDSGTDG
jgi:hypothetical protein